MKCNECGKNFKPKTGQRAQCPKCGAQAEDAKQPTWMKFQCGGGAQWTSTTEDYEGEPCSFSGCNCGTIVKKVGTTTDRDEAFQWFQRPTAGKTAYEADVQKNPKYHDGTPRKAWEKLGALAQSTWFK